MNHGLLKSFFERMSLPFGTDAESLAMLRKQLLLEIKSSGENGIFINGRLYLRNDIITFFDEPETVFDPHEIVETYPILRKIYDPSKYYILTPFPEQLAAHRDFEKFRLQEAAPHYPRFSHELQTALVKQELDKAAGLAELIAVFTDEQQFELKKRLRIVILNQVEEIRKIARQGYEIAYSAYSEYYLSRSYYMIIKAIGGDDREFLFRQMKGAEIRLNAERNPGIIFAMYKQMQKLSFDPFVLAQVKAIANKYRRAVKKLEDDNDEKMLRFAVTVICIILFIVVLVYFV